MVSLNFCKRLGGRPRFFEQVEHQTTYASMGNKHFTARYFHRQTYQNYEQSRQRTLEIEKFKKFDL